MTLRSNAWGTLDKAGDHHSPFQEPALHHQKLRVENIVKQGKTVTDCIKTYQDFFLSPSHPFPNPCLDPLLRQGLQFWLPFPYGVPNVSQICAVSSVMQRHSIALSLLCLDSSVSMYKRIQKAIWECEGYQTTVKNVIENRTLEGKHIYYILFSHVIQLCSYAFLHISPRRYAEEQDFVEL